ncbi:unnamed protein product [Eruca vesicaria subsp. sativa]|uniref:DUF220 domain-containing protein n=1 Tax=Eruca vesicaria subsp. sativa TaxID=29727 RepID=A0ABC8LVB9_ERUVS|nr:unnamed protein product [Eruca vesicaria subsp. sativa]
MGIFPGFGAWVSQNTQHPTKSEKKVKSKPKTEAKTHEESDETKEQLKLWRDANKKEQYHEPPPKVKKAVSREVTSENDEGEGNPPTVKLEKELSWNFLFLSGTIPIRLIVAEDPKKLSVYYEKQKKGIRIMETFEGKYEVEPVYVDAERLCKHMKPKSQEEYRKCSGGKGLIASKVIVDLTFRPASPWDLPLVSSYFRRFTIETTKKVAEDLQMQAGDIRGL